MAQEDYPEQTAAPTLGRWSFAAAVALVAIATGIGLLLTPWLSLASLGFLSLLPVIVMADRGGLSNGLAAAALGALSLNFFFIPPIFTLAVARPDNAVTLAVFVGVAMAVSSLADRRRLQAAQSERAAAENALLASLSQQLARIADPAELREFLRSRLVRWSGSEVRFLAAADLDTAILLSPMDVAAARWAHAHGEAAGKGGAVMPGADALYLPLGAGGGEHVIAQFWNGDVAAPIPAERLGFIRQVLDRGGDALQRADLMARQATLDEQRRHDVLRETLLNSIGHDLRTPLATIRAALGTIRSDDREALAGAKLEVDRLDRMIANVLDLARLRADGARIERVPVDLTDVVDAAIDAMSGTLTAHPLSVDIDPELPLVLADARMLHHMLINLIDNARKYSPAGSPIAIAARDDDGEVLLSITDRGPGLGAADANELFAAFRRGTDSDRTPGSGLGLAVVAGFADAMSLTIGAADDSPSGAVFTIRFPARC